MAERLGELGFYTLAGAPESPRELIEEVAQAEALGLGTVFLSERFDLKEAATITGAPNRSTAAAARMDGASDGQRNRRHRRRRAGRPRPPRRPPCVA